MTISWVLGSGGLLGSALCRALRLEGKRVFLPAERFTWNDPVELVRQLSAAVESFALQANKSDRWEIYWAAGTGTMSSTLESFDSEKNCLALLLELLLSKSKDRLRPECGSIVLASSAGAIYAGTGDCIVTENTPPAPTTPYAFAKIQQEALIREFVASNHGLSALIARITTLYGPGQAIGKQQGLLAHIARNILRRQPIQIYVPYDTMRNYIAADDAANQIICAMRQIRQQNIALVTKIVAAERSTTIAEIISIFKRIARRLPRIVTSANKLTALYVRQSQYKSIILDDCSKLPSKSLFVGIAEVMMAERAAYVRGNMKKISS